MKSYLSNKTNRTNINDCYSSFSEFASNAKKLCKCHLFLLFEFACHAKGFATAFLFLLLRVRRNALQLPVLFLFSSFSSVFQKWTGKTFFGNISPFITQDMCDQHRTCFLGQTVTSICLVIFVLLIETRVIHDVVCALKKN